MLKPRIGIRPAINGRWGGIRESLEHCVKEISKPNIDTLISLRSKYGVTGKHSKYKKII